MMVVMVWMVVLTEQFRRLMGIKAAPKPQEVSSKWGRDDKKMLR